MVANWIETQHTAFVRWCNMYLTTLGYPPVANLAKDFASGVQLCRLVECITDQPIGKIREQPKYLENYENVQLALDLLKHNGVKIDLVGAPDIVDGNLKMILGLIWQLILKFTVDDINQDGVAAKDGLLLWCKRKASYCGVEINDFSKSWTDGLAMCAILDNYRSDLLDFSQVPKDDPLKCIQMALDAAKEAGLPALLEASEFVDGVDEKSLITTMAYWYHSFSKLDRIDTASRRIEKFVDVWAVALKMKREYEQRMKALLEKIRNQQSQWSEATLDTLEAITEGYHVLQVYKQELKRVWAKEKSELLQLYGNIRIKLSTFGFKQYTPEPELQPQYLNAQWLSLLEAEQQHWKLLVDKLHSVKDQLRHQFANKANEMASSLHSVTVQVSCLGGDLDSQLSEIVHQSETLSSLKQVLSDLKILDKNCRALGIEDNDYTLYTFEELSFELKLAERAVANKLAFIENQLVAQQSKITPELLDEFETVFRHCDQHHKNRLDENEFKAALVSLGIPYEESSKEAFDVIKDDNDRVSFHNFIVYMQSITKDETSSLTQISKSFEEISNGKPIVTRQDLENALLPDETIDTLTELLPKTESGYDFKAYIESMSI